MNKNSILIIGLTLIITAFVLLIFINEDKIIFSSENVKYEEAFQRALKLSSPQECDKINQYYDLDDHSLTPNEAIDKCKYEYAIKTDDLEYCQTLSSRSVPGGISPKNVCTREIAKNKNDQTICSLMTNRDYIYLCKREVATDYEEYRSCISQGGLWKGFGEDILEFECISN